jgi:Nif-specific regulatory protein
MKDRWLGMADSGELERIRRERDLYERLLALGRQTELNPLLKEALMLVVELAEARHGYLELHDDEDRQEPRWWIASGFSDEQIRSVRAALSSGIVAEAIATGKTVVTDSALLDARFGGRDSVLTGRIGAVLCAPIGDDPPRGVLYLEGRRKGGLFSAADRERAELFARHLAPLVDRLVAEHRERDTADPTRQLRATLRLDGVIGHSAALAAVLKQVALVAPLDVTVLLTGESGTGKSQLARLIHDNGPRATQPFIELNCAALPETLLESELFGAMPGAHSGAVRRVEGKVAAAHRGTLFLDEIGELPPTAQAKLLQLLHSRQYFPLGSTQPVRADVRVIAATNADLEQAVAEHRFRPDLFFRLQVLPIRVPSLAERREDIRDLARYFCASACERHGLPRVELSNNVLRTAEWTPWPGNVRELAHAVEAAAIRAAGEGSPQVESRHVFPDSANPAASAENLTFLEATRRFQAEYLRETLEDTEWNVIETARRLDVARSHVYNLIHSFGLRRKND